MPQLYATDPWPWYVSGPLLGLFVPLFLLLIGKDLGISSSFRHACAFALPKSARTSLPYFDYNWRTGLWQLAFVLGIALGGTLSVTLLGGAGVSLVLPEAYGATGLLWLFVGGLLVGFGTRWADGCTSGHTIAGLSHLSWPSLVASACFVGGGCIASAVHRFVLGGTVPLVGGAP